MKKQRLLSLLLALVMVFSMIPAVSAAAFSDVRAADWFADAVDYVVSNNLMGGYNATTFGPNDNLSRAMVVQVLYNKEGQPAVSGKHGFTDVPTSQWFNNAVTWGTQKGVMGGYGDGKFGPNDDVTIEQIAVILWNYSGNPSFTAQASSVGTHSAWASNGLGWAVEVGLLANVPYSSVSKAATRAQTAQMLTNYLSGSGIQTAGTAVSSISLDITAHQMGEGWTQYLTATLSPANAANTAITWSSSDPKVATVDQNGKVTGVAGGEATITATSVNGKTATCKVEVWHSHKLTETRPNGTDGVTEIYTCACGHSYDKWIPATSVPSTSSGMDRLAAYVRTNGFPTDDGEYALVYSPDSESNAFIVYNPAKNLLQFLFGYEADSSDMTAGFEYDLTTGTAGPALFIFESYYSEISGFATFNMATFSSENTTLSFTSASGSRLDATANELANTGFKLGLSSWALLLLVEVGMSFEEIGFLNCWDS